MQAHDLRLGRDAGSENEQHVVSGRCDVGVRWGEHGELAAVRATRDGESDGSLVHVDAVSGRAQSDQDGRSDL